jgi:hypothetical protein
MISFEIFAAPAVSLLLMTPDVLSLSSAKLPTFQTSGLVSYAALWNMPMSGLVPAYHKLRTTRTNMQTRIGAFPHPTLSVGLWGVKLFAAVAAGPGEASARNNPKLMG